MTLETILVANRGEIACRVMRTARRLGRRTVAVFSEADAAAPHVAMADRAVAIGPAPAAQSYLDAEKIIAAAQASGADAIHPGYGFLSESAAFAEAVAAAGLTFIGPPAAAIAAMGDKAAAKRRMIAAGVPCVPGYEGEDQSDAPFLKAAEEIGFPVMVKAAAGGGGRGMRLVAEAAALPAALGAARSEAERAFGSGDLILEKAVLKPRHVEIQIFADAHGAVIHLGERDCSVQRRHQKVIEEAPCPVMTPELRAAMGAAAVEAARSIAYRGAGTVEFLLDASGAFYFLEMNTRLQVEHPVTELVTGLDLVALQIAVAEGRPLGIAQEDVAFEGHAIEVRLYAEDPAKGFLPGAGPVEHWRPGGGAGVRVDDGIESGLAVSPFYDPMLAKIMAHGPNRDAARLRLIEALRETALFGVTSNKGFLIDALRHETFAAGGATTAFIAEHFGEEALARPTPSAADLAIAAVARFRLDRAAAARKAIGAPRGLLDWASHAKAATPFRFELGGGAADISVAPRGGDSYRVLVATDGAGEAETLEIAVLAESEDGFRLEIGGARRAAMAVIAPNGDLDIDLGDRAFRLRNLIGRAAASEEAGGGVVRAPTHGRIVSIAVAEGASVAKGDPLLVMEAMKMQQEIAASVDGVVKTVAVAPEAQVAAEDLLIEIETDAAEA
ncbi:MAG: acetyl-CoA carboxylase biotin carboxylase subunit [Pseudomonadota bacterium]